MSALLLSTGPPHDLQITEVRSDSVVLLWKPPVYQGRDPVNGFYLDIREAGAAEEAWRGVNTKATEKTFMKVAIFRSSDQIFFNLGWVSHFNFDFLFCLLHRSRT